jgi:hypothetical protein
MTATATCYSDLLEETVAVVLGARLRPAAIRALFRGNQGPGSRVRASGKGVPGMIVSSHLAGQEQAVPDGYEAEYFYRPGAPLGDLPEGWCALCQCWQQRVPAGEPHAGALVEHGHEAIVLPTRVRRLAAT